MRAVSGWSAYLGMRTAALRLSSEKQQIVPHFSAEAKDLVYLKQTGGPKDFGSRRSAHKGAVSGERPDSTGAPCYPIEARYGRIGRPHLESRLMNLEIIIRL